MGIKNNEDWVTEKLAKLLELKYFRDICLKFLVGQKIDSDNANITSQIEDNTSDGRPDLEIDSDNSYILIENKIRDNRKAEIGTQISDKNGKIGYIETLIKKGGNRNKFLIYIYPENNVNKKEFESVKKQYPKIVKTCTWSKLLEYLNTLQFDSSFITKNLEDINSVIDKIVTFNSILRPKEAVMLAKPENMLDAVMVIAKYKNVITNSKNNILEFITKNSENKLSKSIKMKWTDKIDEEPFVEAVFTIGTGKLEKWFSTGIYLYLINSLNSDITEDSEINKKYLFSLIFDKKLFPENVINEFIEKKMYKKSDGDVWIPIKSDFLLEDDIEAQKKKYLAEVEPILKKYLIPYLK